MPDTVDRGDSLYVGEHYVGEFVGTGSLSWTFLSPVYNEVFFPSGTEASQDSHTIPYVFTAILGKKRWAVESVHNT